jgi:tRNA threonylcarbamoyladenosine biosynthesis protein TsaB
VGSFGTAASVQVIRLIVIGMECSTASGGVAIVRDGALLGGVNFSTSTLYSQRLLPSLEWLLDRCGVTRRDISGIGVSRGPGSFTGLRIGLSAAKGLAYAWGVPVVGIGTMEALALRASSPSPGQQVTVCTIMDARQGELFAGLFKVGCDTHGHVQTVRLHASHVATVADLDAWITEPCVFAGDALLKYGDFVRKQFGDRFIAASPLRSLPSAEEVAWLAYQRINAGQSDDLMMLEPEYLRRSYVQK